jgi:hypothetical protein
MTRDYLVRLDAGLAAVSHRRLADHEADARARCKVHIIAQAQA